MDTNETRRPGDRVRVGDRVMFVPGTGRPEAGRVERIDEAPSGVTYIYIANTRPVNFPALRREILEIIR